jgi:flagellar basal body P-ring protein FlgI
VSAGLSAGVWFWAAILTATGERITVARGEISIAQDLAGVTSQTFDGRSTAEKSLSDAELALANLTASGKKTKKYTIGTRNAEYYTAAELIQAISYWRIKVANERAAKSISDGLGDPRTLMVRFK